MSGFDFPSDIWQAAGVRGATSAPLALSDLAVEVERWHGAPRDEATLARYVSGHLPAGRIALYGAGSHSRLLLSLLARRPDITVVVIVDRRADAIGEFEGHPVTATVPDAAVDYVLVAHTSYEGEMARALVAQGIPAERILCLYADPAYGALALPVAAALAAGAAGAPADAVIVSCSQTAVVPDGELSALLPPGRTVQLFMGRREGMENGGVYRTYDMAESVTALRLSIERLRPRLLYVRSIVYKNFLAPVLKAWFPDVTVIGEFYDFSILWADGDLERLMGMDGPSVQMLRQSEHLACAHLDLIVSKRGGAHWDRTVAGFDARHILYFPAVTSTPDGPPPPERADFIYAGFLPSSTFLRTFDTGYNFLPLMKEVCGVGAMTADIYNSGHVAPTNDALFADYSADMGPPGPVRYHARVPYAQLLAGMGGYGFGWLCDHEVKFQGDRHVGICNRWTGYVSGGLPCLIDAGWSFMVDLVREYGAGIVVERLDARTIIAAARNADHPALRAGTRRLRTHLLAHNTAALDDIAQVVDRALTQAPRKPLP